MPKTLLGWGGVLMPICISRFINPSKPIRKKYPNRPKMHKLEFISHVYTFYLDNFGGVEF